MSRPKLLPPLAPETLAVLHRLAPVMNDGLAPRHDLNADADPRLLAIVRQVSASGNHLRVMDAAAKAGEIVTQGETAGKPTAPAARWAKRCLAAFTEVCRVATEAGDDAFPMHLEAIERGRDAPPLPMRGRVWKAWQWVSVANRPPLSDDELAALLEAGNKGIQWNPYIPTAGEVAAAVSASDKVADLSVRDCVNHLKALGLPYAPARRGRRKSI